MVWRKVLGLRRDFHPPVGVTAIRRTTATFALALSLLGCGSGVLPSNEVEPADRVELATWSADGFSLDANGDPVIGCILIGAKGRLVVDPSFGGSLGDLWSPVQIRPPRPKYLPRMSGHETLKSPAHAWTVAHVQVALIP